MNESTWSRDFDELALGDEFATSPHVVSEREVLIFAALTGDHHPAHVDKDWAAAGPFGEQIAHGMLVMSMAVGLVPFDPERVIALRRVSDVVFRRPIKLGDRITVEGRLDDLKPMTDDAGLACWRWTIRDGQGRPACRAEVEVLWRRDSGPAEDAWEIEMPSYDHHGRLPIAL